MTTNIHREDTVTQFDDALQERAIPGKGSGVVVRGPIRNNTTIAVGGVMWVIDGEASNTTPHAADFYTRAAARFMRKYPHLFQAVQRLESEAGVKGQVSDESFYRGIFKRNRFSYTNVAWNGETVEGSAVNVFQGSMFNHSCVPDFRVYFEYDDGIPVGMNLLAIRDINTNDREVHISYIGDPNEGDLERAVLVRRHYLWKTWGFVCNCHRCLQEMRDVPKVLCQHCANRDLNYEVWGLSGASSLVSGDRRQQETLSRLVVGLPFEKNANMATTRNSHATRSGVVAHYNENKHTFHIVFDDDESTKFTNMALGLVWAGVQRAFQKSAESPCAPPCSNFQARILINDDNGGSSSSFSSSSVRGNVIEIPDDGVEGNPIVIRGNDEDHQDYPQSSRSFERQNTANHRNALETRGGGSDCYVQDFPNMLFVPAPHATERTNRITSAGCVCMSQWCVCVRGSCEQFVPTHYQDCLLYTPQPHKRVCECYR